MDGGESHGKFLANGGLAFDGKRISDAGDGGGDIDSVQGGEDKMAGFGGGYGNAHGFGVAHFADDDHIGSLAQGGAESSWKIRSVGADFDLLDNAANVGVLVLDGVFDDDDVARFAVIDFVDERGHGGGFTGAGGAAEEHETTREAGQVFDGGRKAKFAEGGDFGRQGADGGGGTGPFAMEIDAEAAETLNAIRGIGDSGVAKNFQGMLAESGDDGGFDFGAIENRVFDFADFPVLTNAGRSALNEEQVAAVAMNERGKPVIQARGSGGIVGTGLAAIEFASDLIEIERIVHRSLTGGDMRGEAGCSLPEKDEGVYWSVVRNGRTSVLSCQCRVPRFGMQFCDDVPPLRL